MEQVTKVPLERPEDFNNLTLLLKVISQLLPSLEVKQIFSILTEKARDYFEADIFWLSSINYQSVYISNSSRVIVQDYSLVYQEHLAGKGLGGWAYRERRTVSCENYWSAPLIEHEQEVDRRANLAIAVAGIATPVFLDDELEALIGVAKNHPHEWKPDEIAKIEQIADIVSMLIQYQKLQDQKLILTKEKEQLSTLLEFSQEFSNEISQPLTILQLELDLIDTFNQPATEYEIEVMRRAVTQISQKLREFRQFMGQSFFNY
jgi:GAF domain-containing protein